MHTSASCASDSFMKRATEVVRGGGGGLEIHSTIYIVLSVLSVQFHLTVIIKDIN